MSRGRVPTGLFLEMRQELQQAGYKLRVADERAPCRFESLPWPEKIRPYQRQAVEAMVKASNTGGIVLVATGAGKTFLTGEFLRRLNGTAAFVVDELTLLAQAQRELEAAIGEKVGTVGKSLFQPRRVSVATIQTLHKHRERKAFKNWFSQLDVVVLDEVHLAINRRNIGIVQQVKPKAVFGLTATLQMEKPHVQLPVTALTGPVVFRYDIRKGVKQGYLSQGTVVRLQFHDPLKGKAPEYKDTRANPRENVWMLSGSQAAEYRYHISLNKARNDCVEALVREGVKAGRRTVVLVERLAHLRVLAHRLKDLPHRVLCGAYSQEDRLEAMRMMDAGELPLILASRVFGKGVDISTLDLIIDATGLPGRNGALQRYGRGARRAEGKPSLLYVDICDVGNSFAGAAHSRKAALLEIGCPVKDVVWKGNAKSIIK
jgi:superfamily II DNA or RNA helicase